MIAAGGQHESPGGSAPADRPCVLRFLSPHLCQMCVSAAATSGAAVWAERRACVTA